MVDRGQLSESLTSFLFSTSWSESCRFLVLHPDLLDPAVDDLIGTLLKSKREEVLVRAFEQQQRLLRRSRKIGIDAAFAELSGEPRALVIEDDLGVLKQQAEDAQRHYERTGKHEALEVAVHRWMTIYTDLRDPDQLRRCVAAFEAAIPQSATPSVWVLQAALGVARALLYNATLDPQELERSIRALELALTHPPARSSDRIEYLGNLVRAAQERLKQSSEKD